VPLILFPSLRYVRRKPCTNFASKSSTISKWTKPSFHLRLISKEYHQVRPKLFRCLWYLRCKPCSNLTPTLTLSTNGPKRDSTRPTSLTSSIGCIQNYLLAYGTFSANLAPILHQVQHYLQTNRTELALEPRHLGVPSSASKMISMPMVRSVQIVLLCCTNTNTVYKWTKTRFHMAHVTYKFHRVRQKLFMT
jgi:hypothetical protein